VSSSSSESEDSVSKDSDSDSENELNIESRKSQTPAKVTTYKKMNAIRKGQPSCDRKKQINKQKTLFKQREFDDQPQPRSQPPMLNHEQVRRESLNFGNMVLSNRQRGMTIINKSGSPRKNYSKKTPSSKKSPEIKSATRIRLSGYLGSPNLSK